MIHNQPVAITLKYWQWMILIGWCEAHRRDEESILMTDIFATISKSQSEAAQGESA